MNWSRYAVDGRGWGVPFYPELSLALSLITWVLVIAILVAVLRWLWKKGNK